MNLSPPDLIRALSQPLEPIPTSLEPKLPSLPDIRSVVFDVYGTLVISGSGDIGVSEGIQKETALRSILRDLAITPPYHDTSLSERLVDFIREEHTRAHQEGIDFPEVEIRELWAKLLEIQPGPDLETVAIAYECASNPVWPMPGSQDLLDSLQAAGISMGIVSNAQFYTPYLFESFYLRALDQLGFYPDLSFFSYRHRRAKPGTWLYAQLRDALEARGIQPQQVLYIGNDALKDIHPAAQLGFRTALFAGDQRSLRLHSERFDLEPADAIITQLQQVLDILDLNPDCSSSSENLSSQA